METFLTEKERLIRGFSEVVGRTGIGADMKVLRRAFKCFYQVLFLYNSSNGNFFDLFLFLIDY